MPATLLLTIFTFKNTDVEHTVPRFLVNDIMAKQPKFVYEFNSPDET